MSHASISDLSAVSEYIIPQAEANNEE